MHHDFTFLQMGGRVGWKHIWWLILTLKQTTTLNQDRTCDYRRKGNHEAHCANKGGTNKLRTVTTFREKPLERDRSFKIDTKSYTTLYCSKAIGVRMACIRCTFFLCLWTLDIGGEVLFTKKRKRDFLNNGKRSNWQPHKNYASSIMQ